MKEYTENRVVRENQEAHRVVYENRRRLLRRTGTTGDVQPPRVPEGGSRRVKESQSGEIYSGYTTSET